MSLQTYMDLIENPIKNWISIFCKLDPDNINANELLGYISGTYCVLFPEKINGIKKCVMIYVDIAYPPFEKTDYKIANNKYLDLIVNNLYDHIRRFYLETARSILESNIFTDTQMNLKILQNTGLCISGDTHTLLPYPIDEDYIKENINLYRKLGSLDKFTDRSQREIFNYYEKHVHRIGINVEILDIDPPKKIISDLLSNYQSDDESSDDSFDHSDFI